MKIHFIQNDELATPGFIEEWVNGKKYSLSRTRMYDGEAFPSMDQFDLLIILGGRMGAYEESIFPWLIQEKQFIREAIDQGKWILGICLGSQLLADVLGGKVYPHTHQEIGWWPVEKTEEAGNSKLFTGVPQSLIAFQFHGDTFDLPVGAIRLASNSGCTNQAFSYGDRVLGLQFHPEFTGEMIDGLEHMFGSQIREGEFIEKPQQWVNQNQHLNGAKSMLFTILNNFEANISKKK
ncbi:type 1 glutamine amidotransferase [Bacillus sp. S3]|uniref:type 1 glutamine amidotransferase n=1 Tax=Bacillus sp. S3 TaxID=486398 RepID=UPI00118D1A56|nr:type 1 glutamine amidotransferase [Bacillus sp. S3]QCJ42625.1 type 1 glutamine amidotransferase [Bacillus sp. S3]